MEIIAYRSTQLNQEPEKTSDNFQWKIPKFRGFKD